MFVGCPMAVGGWRGGWRCAAVLFVGWRGVARRDCASVRGCQAKTAFLVAP